CLRCFLAVALTRRLVSGVQLSGAPSRFPSSARASWSQRAFSFPLVSPSAVVVRSLSVLTDGLSCPFTPGPTIPGKIRRPTYDTICAWIGPHWTMRGLLGHSLPSLQNEKG